MNKKQSAVANRMSAAALVLVARRPLQGSLFSRFSNCSSALAAQQESSSLLESLSRMN